MEAGESKPFRKEKYKAMQIEGASSFDYNEGQSKGQLVFMLMWCVVIVAVIAFFLSFFVSFNGGQRTEMDVRNRQQSYEEIRTKLQERTESFSSILTSSDQEENEK